MFWGCFTWEGPGYGSKIDGNMDTDLYLKIMDEELQQSLEWWGVDWADKVFQQDNDPKHTSKKAKQWFEDNQIPVMEWPAQSPDLNPIEHLWHYLKRQLTKYTNPPTSIHELWERVEKEWEAMSVEECQKLIESMPNRVQAVLKAKGGYVYESDYKY